MTGCRSAVPALACMLALAFAACRSAALPLWPPSADKAWPAATPAMSLAGDARVPCAQAENHLLAFRFPRGRPTDLDFSRYENMEAGTATGIAHAIAREFGCDRHMIEVTVPLLDVRVSRESPLPPPGGRAILLETMMVVPSDGVSLWTLADYLSVNAREPFVYGTSIDLSEGESFSLRLEPKGSNLRLMLVYRVEL